MFQGLARQVCKGWTQFIFKEKGIIGTDRGSLIQSCHSVLTCNSHASGWPEFVSGPTSGYRLSINNHCFRDQFVGSWLSNRSQTRLVFVGESKRRKVNAPMEGWLQRCTTCVPESNATFRRVRTWFNGLPCGLEIRNCFWTRGSSDSFNTGCSQLRDWPCLV